MEAENQRSAAWRRDELVPGLALQCAGNGKSLTSTVPFTVRSLLWSSLPYVVVCAQFATCRVPLAVPSDTQSPRGVVAEPVARARAVQPNTDEHLLAELRIRDADDLHVGDHVGREQELLDLAGMDVLTATDEVPGRDSR
jgi:hypothetical protein